VESDLPGLLRRVRRLADLSQRELAHAIETSKSAVAAAETGHSGLDVRLLARAAALAHLRIALVDGDGTEIAGMSGAAVRDRSGRRFPAHLDTRYGDEGWWHGPERYSRTQPWYTFDRLRYTRDHWRGRRGTPDDHQLPQPGDSPEERVEARRRAAERRRREAQERWLLEAPWRPWKEHFTCDCPPLCEELDDRSGKPVHAPECACGCDVA
jgi:transcriptional regulator with XRE-family HTH domain